MDEQNLAGGNMEIKNAPESPKMLNSSMKIFLALGIFGLAFVAAAGWGVYRVYAKTGIDKFSVLVAKALRLPAVKVGDDLISYTDFADDIKAIHVMRQYDQKQRANGKALEKSPGAELTDEQMTDQVLWRLVNNLLVKNAAKKYEVVAEDKDAQNLKEQMYKNVEREYQDAMAAKTSQAKDVQEYVNLQLLDRYGWRMDVYEQKVMRPFILQTKLAQKLKTDVALKEELRTKAQKVLQEVKNGADFAALAKQHSEDSSSAQGGDLGWFGKEEMVPEFGQAAFSLKKGEVFPSVVETMYGYHIIKLDDKKMEKEKNKDGKLVSVEKASARHILFRFVDLPAYFDKMLKSVKIKLYLNAHDPFAEIRAQSAAVQVETQK